MIKALNGEERMPGLKHVVKGAALRGWPGGAQRLQAAWRRHHVRRLEHRLGITRVRNCFISQNGSAVLQGPFTGMKYIRRAVGSTATPKLIGSYEIELQPWMEEICSTEYGVIVDIGCAEGYYAVGLAIRLSFAKVYAFDTDPLAQRLCRKMAAANDVADRLVILGECRAACLNELVRPPTLVLCDCEGAEDALLDPAKVPALLTADLVVELHDHLVPGVTHRLLDRFTATHEIAFQSQQSRNHSEFRCLDFLALADRDLALSEMRSCPQKWAYMKTRRAPMQKPSTAIA